MSIAAKQYMTIEVEVDIYNSENSDAVVPEEGLYGHGDATAFFLLKYELGPATKRSYETRLRARRDVAPEIELKSCTAFWADVNGDDRFEREYELSDEQYEAAVQIARAAAARIRMNVTIENEAMEVA